MNAETESASDEWMWFLRSLDQKLDHLRLRQDDLAERLNQLEQRLIYLTHKHEMQIKENQQHSTLFQHETEHKVSEIHYLTREELSHLARRVDAIEKLLF